MLRSITDSRHYINSLNNFIENTRVQNKTSRAVPHVASICLNWSRSCQHGRAIRIDRAIYSSSDYIATLNKQKHNLAWLLLPLKMIVYSNRIVCVYDWNVPHVSRSIFSKAHVLTRESRSNTAKTNLRFATAYTS